MPAEMLNGNSTSPDIHVVGHINTHRNPGTDIVSKIISYLSDIFKGFAVFCRKNFFKKFVISGRFPD